MERMVDEQTILDIVSRYTDVEVLDVAFKNYVIQKVNYISTCSIHVKLY
jgi:hypothetical protein